MCTVAPLSTRKELGSGKTFEFSLTVKTNSLSSGDFEIDVSFALALASTDLALFSFRQNCVSCVEVLQTLQNFGLGEFFLRQ